MNPGDINLIRDYLDDRIDSEGLNRLNHLLETDADARAEFRAMASLEEGLRDFSAVADVVEQPHPRIPVGRSEGDSAPIRTHIHPVSFK